MRVQWFVCLLLAGLAYGQATPATPPAAAANKTAQNAPAAPPAQAVAPDDPVLTVKGVCADTSKQGEDCKTTVTRAQFDKLADALQPNMPAAIRRNLANQYATALVMSAAAEKRGLDKQPQFAEVVRFARMQILSVELRRALQEEAGKLTDADFEEYYRKNAGNFEQAELLRLYIPHNKQIVNPTPDAKEAALPPQNTREEDAAKKEAEFEAKQKAGEEEMKKLAAALHARAVQGEDFDKLEKEAFAAAGFKGTPPDPKMSKARRTTLPPKHAVAMDLKSGEVSELLSDPSGYYVYKMVSKQTLPLESVKEEIRGTVSSQRYREAMQAFQKMDNTELNDAYFGPAPKPPVRPMPRGGKAPEQGEEDHN